MTAELTSHYDHNALLQAIIGEYLEALDTGEKVAVRGIFLAKHPAFAAELVRFFEDEDRSAGILAFSSADWRENDAPESVPYFGKFVDLTLIGKGGMGVVYRAVQKDLNCVVALKMMRGSNPSPEAVRRFQHEMEFVARMRHPNIVSIREVGMHEGAYFYTMDFVQGTDLSQQVPFTPEALPQAARLLIDVARAVDHAHQRGILHRDLKPANILIDSDGKPFLTDFGLAKWLDRDNSASSRNRIVGSLPYMAPEHFDGRDSTIRTDVYGLGAILYAILTGRAPFVAETHVALIHKIASEQPPPPRQYQPALARRINRDLETICLKCLRKDPGQRYDRAGDLADDLDRWLRNEPIHARPIGLLERSQKWARRHPAAASLAALGLAAILAIMLIQWYYSRRLERLNLRLVDSNRVAEQRRRDLQAIFYDSQLSLAGRAWDEAQIDRVRTLLESAATQSSDGRELRGWEWFYLNRLCHADLCTFQAHAGQATCLAFSSDGARLATGGTDGAIRIWELARAVEVADLQRHSGPIAALAFHPRENWLASAGADARVHIWNLENGTVLFTLTGHVMPVTSLAFRPDGSQLATASLDATVRTWDVGTGRQLHVFQGHNAGVRAVAYRPDGRVLASAGDDGMIHIWNVDSGTRQRVLSEPSFKPQKVRFSPDGAALAAGGGGERLVVWNPNRGAEILSIDSPDGAFTDLAFAPDGSQIATAGTNQTLRLWNATTGSSLGHIRGHLGPVNAVSYSPRGGVLASVGADGCAKVWSAVPVPESTRLARHLLRVTGLAFSPDGQRLATSSYDQDVKLWDLRKGTELRHFGDHEIDRGVATEGRPGPIRSIISRSGHSQLATAVAYSPNGERVASAGADNTVRIWCVATGQELLKLKHGGLVSSVAYSPDGRRLASGCWDDLAYLWDAQTGELLGTFSGHDDNVTAVAFSPTGRWLATGSEDRLIRLWDLSHNREPRSLPDLVLTGHTAEVTCVAFNRQGDRLASGSDDQTVRLWDLPRGTPSFVLQGHTGRVTAVAFSPSGTRLASVGQAKWDRPVRLWDTATGREVASYGAESSGGAHGVAFSPDGRRLAAAVGNNVYLWDSEPPSGAAPSRTVQARAIREGRAPEEPQYTQAIEVLGSLRARRLPDAQRPGRFYEPPRDREFLVVVLAVPLWQMLPSEDDYRTMKAGTANTGTNPLAPRYSMADFSRHRFRLRQGSARAQSAVLLAPWPLEPDGKGGFSAGWAFSSTDRIKQGDRQMVAAAFAAASDSVEAHLQIELDDLAWVTVPDLQVEGPLASSGR